MAIDFEDDGASFRIRRQRQLNEMFRQERVVIIDGRTGKPDKPPASTLLKTVRWIVAGSFAVFVGVLVACIVDFGFWLIPS